MMLQSTSAEFKSMSTLTAWEPIPIMQMTFLLGRDLVPPKVFGKCMIIMFLLALAAKITVSTSSTNNHSFSTLFSSELRKLLNACTFLLLVSLLKWLINQLDQVVCDVMVFVNLLRIYSLQFDCRDELLNSL
jgi:hypothetical protein